MKVSVVIPVHNEEKNIPILYEELKRVMNELEKEGYCWEVIFVNDGSSDGSLKVLKALKSSEKCVRVLNMDRNRGQSAALSAGFFYATGDIVVSMDGDGQNDPKYIKDLIKKIEEGYTVVTGYRIKRKAPFITKKLPSRIANWLISKVTRINTRDNGCSLKAYRGEVPKRWQIPKGMHRFLPALFGVKNEEVCEIPVVDRPRKYGKSHYGLKRTLEVLRDLATLPFILKNPPRFEKFFKVLSTLTGSLVFVWGILSYFFPKLWYIEGVWIILFFYSFVVYRNLKRFNEAQVKGVFKVEEI